MVDVKEHGLVSLATFSTILYQKILRTNVVAKVLQSSNTHSHCLYSSLENGWYLHGKLFRLKWFECEMMPSNLDAFSIPYDEDLDSDNYDEEESGDSETDEENED